MLFRRRNPPTRTEKLRVAMWPRASWARSFKYFSKRVLRLSASPHVIAVGFACGVLVSWTPFVGFHFLMSAVIALILGGNLLASAIGTAFGNPFTFPFMWWSSFELGHRILGIKPAPGGLHPGLGGFWEGTWSEVLPILQPMLVGAVPLGTVAAIISYFVVRAAVAAYQTARRRRLEDRRLATTTTPAQDP